MKFIKLMLLDLLYFTEVRNKMYQFVIGVQPLVFLFLLKFMTSLSDTFQSSFILSIGIMSGWAFVLYSSGVAIVGERWVGTLELIIHTKTSLFTIIIAKAINTALLGIGTILLTILYSPLFSSKYRTPSHHVYRGFRFYFPLISLNGLFSLCGLLFCY